MEGKEKAAIGPSVPLSLSLEATVSPSEDRAKVVTAVMNVIGDAPCQEEGGPELVRVTSEERQCLQKLHDQLRDRRVRDSARRLLERRRDGGVTTLLLNRQVAFKGTIVLCENDDESPLGPLVLTLRSKDLDSLIEWLTAHPEPSG